jgi:hypothetical protein
MVSCKVAYVHLQRKYFHGCLWCTAFRFDANFVDMVWDTCFEMACSCNPECRCHATVRRILVAGEGRGGPLIATLVLNSYGSTVEQI